jgi:hypothetical protein
MSARKKLNAANFLGSFIVAGLIGGVTGSWIVFWIAFASLLLAAYHAGDIRRVRLLFLGLGLIIAVAVTLYIMRLARAALARAVPPTST